MTTQILPRKTPKDNQIPPQFRRYLETLPPEVQQAHKNNFRLMADLHRRLDNLKADFQRIEGKLERSEQR